MLSGAPVQVHYVKSEVSTPFPVTNAGHPSTACSQRLALGLSKQFLTTETLGEKQGPETLLYFHKMLSQTQEIRSCKRSN